MAGDMTVREAGQKGGRALSARIKAEEPGSGYYQRIGKLGGDKLKKARGLGFYAAIGQKGGIAMRAKVEKGDPDYYHRIGTKGGAAMKLKGPEYFAAIGKKGLEKRWGKKKKAK